MRLEWWINATTESALRVPRIADLFRTGLHVHKTRTQRRAEAPSIKIGEANATDPLTAEPSCKDEARIGQKNKITRRWAKRGTRPSAPRDQRTASTYIFGAICPKQGKGAALILPFCNTEAMNLHLAEIAKAVAPGAHAVLLVDQAGWHLSAGLLIPANITILALNSIRSKISGSICATTGSRTASSNPTTI
jgi:hypothetical protein